MENKSVLLSVNNLDVKFHVRGRILTAIRNISLDIYENESIAIVGESGSGKSVFTKTFAGMLDQNGFIGNGEIIFNDNDLADTKVRLHSYALKTIEKCFLKLNVLSKLEFGSDTYNKIKALKTERKLKSSITEEESLNFETKLKGLVRERTTLFNLKQTFDSSKDKQRIKDTTNAISKLDKEIKSIQNARLRIQKERSKSVEEDLEYIKVYTDKINTLKSEYVKDIKQDLHESTVTRNKQLAKEIYLSVGRYGFKKRSRMIKGLLDAFKDAMESGEDLSSDTILNAIFDKVAFRVKYIDETATEIHGTCVLNLANIKYEKDWNKIRGGKIATVFQDPMTSLNPIITIGKQITSIILKHQNCTEVEARERALKLMQRVGIPEVEKRFDDYPFQYSGGMRQRIVIAIALSCNPKILICDEPTTALDVTIQAQILELLKDLQKEFNFTIVFITHDLGVVANIADRVAVIYSGQIVELGTADDIFYDPRHPYTWALLSSLPQLADKDAKLFSITGTPPSLYNPIIGDAFAPRNPHCLKIDTLQEPPMFKISETHYAKTWLLDPRSPNIDKPDIIKNTREKLLNAFNIGEV